MTPNVCETPALKVVCESQDCDKEYATKGGMKDHYKKKHKTVGDIQSPLGRFPSTTSSARVLFEDSALAEQQSTQGYSKGEVNSPKVVTGATYQCNKCSNEYPTKEELIEHMSDDHDKAQLQAEPNNSQEEGDLELRQVGEESEQQIAHALENMAMEVLATSKCHECKLGKEVNTHQEKTIRLKESKIASMERRQKKTDEKKMNFIKRKISFFVKINKLRPSSKSVRKS